MVCCHGVSQHTKEKKPGNSSEAFAGSGWESGQGITLDVGAHSLVGGSCEGASKIAKPKFMILPKIAKKEM